MNVTNLSIKQRRVFHRQARSLAISSVNAISLAHKHFSPILKMAIFFWIFWFGGFYFSKYIAALELSKFFPNAYHATKKYLLSVSFSQLYGVYVIALCVWLIMIAIAFAVIIFKDLAYIWLLPQATKQTMQMIFPMFTDSFLRSRKYIFVTFASQADKEKHKQDLQDLMTKHPHKKLVVYVLPRRVPFMLELDNEIMCYDVENGRLRVLGFIQDTKDHSRLPIAMSEHKLGIRLPNEVISKNYEVMSLSDN